MDPAIGAAVIGGITNTANQINQNAYNKFATEQEFRNSMKAWEIQNAYNTPAAQMERYKEAGLNPNLIYGQGTSGNAAQVPQYHAPQQNFDMGGPMQSAMSVLSQYQSMKVQAAQEDRIKADTAMINYNMSEKIRNEAFNDLLKQSRAQISAHDASHKALTADLRFYKAIEDLNKLIYGNNLARHTLEYMMPAKLANIRADTATKQFIGKYMLPIQEKIAKTKFLEDFSNYKYGLNEKLYKSNTWLHGVNPNNIGNLWNTNTWKDLMVGVAHELGYNLGFKY